MIERATDDFPFSVLDVIPTTQYQINNVYASFECFIRLH